MRGLSPSALSAVAGVTALIGAVKGLVNAGMGMVNMSSHFEQTQKGLETVMQSAEKGAKLFEDLRKFSFQTTFGVDELASASTQLLNVGESTRSLQKDLKMLGDLAQGDKRKFMELTSVFSKITSNGKAGAEQLEMLAIRGIPIKQTLKEMGVTGVASAEQIKKAFEKLTSEGGNFYNAMNNINDTIEGKRGFIADTLKEIQVNLSSITGLTDTYKKGLDTLYEVLNGFNNVLMKLNDNPVMKAIIQGVMITAITGLAGILITSIVPVLSTIIAKLVTIAGLKTIITGGWVGLAVGGIGALTMGIVNYTSKQRDLESQLEATTKAMDKQTEHQRLNDEYQELSAELTEIESKLVKVKGNMNFYKNNKSKFIDSETGEKQEGWYVNQDAYLEEYNKYTELMQKAQEVRSKMSGTDEELQKWEALSNALLQYNTLLKEQNNIMAESSIGKLKKDINDYTNQLNDMKSLLAMNGKEYEKDDGSIGILKLDDKQKKEIDDTVSYLQRKIDNVKIKVAVESQEEWQKDLQRAFNFSDKDVSKNATSSSIKALETWEEKLNSYNNKMQMFNTVINEGQSHTANFIEKKIGGLESAIDVLMNSENYDGSEESLKKYVEKLKELKQVKKEALGKDMVANIQEENRKYKEILETSKSLKDKYIEIYAIQSGITKEQAEQYLNEKKQNDNLKTRAELIESIMNSTSGMNFSSLTELGKSDFLNGDYLKGVMETLSGSMGELNGQVGLLISSIVKFSTGDALGGALDLLMIVISGFTSLNDILLAVNRVVQKVQKILTALSPVLNIVYRAFYTVGNIIGFVAEVVELLINVLYPVIGLFEVFMSELQMLFRALEKMVQWVNKKLKESDYYQVVHEQYNKALSEIDAIAVLEDEQETEAELLKTLNNEYQNLLSAMEEQEEYYISQKKQINASSYTDSILGVNDMILTPQGNFSTHPDDYIIATKNPNSLGGGTVVNKIEINNTVSDSVDVSVVESDEEGINKLIVTISQKIASDYADGSNGWDNAVASRNYNGMGRRLIN